MPKRKYGIEQVKELLAAFGEYIADTDDPHLAGFISGNPTALKYWLTDEDLDNYIEFRPYVKRALKKTEAYLLTSRANGPALPMSIFRLKQPYHGYRDRFEQDITSNGEKVQFINSVPRPIKKAEKLKKGHKTLNEE